MLGENSQPFSFKGQDLAGVNFDYEDLLGVDFTNTNLESLFYEKQTFTERIYIELIYK